MGVIYVIPGAAVLIEWFLAAALYAFGWRRAQRGFNRGGDGLVLAGVVTSLAGVAWLAWDVAPGLAFARSSLATGLAVSMLAIYAVLIRWRAERRPVFLILGLAIPAQAYAVGRLWWQVEAAPRAVFLPLWMVLRAVTGLIGTGALGVGVAMIVLALAFYRTRDWLPEGRHTLGAVELSTLQWRSVYVALVALSASLSFDLARSWLGLGQVMEDGFVWSLIAWLLVTAGACGLMQEAIPRRLAHPLLVLALAAAIGAVLSMAG
jgi:hypothetical protein